MTAYPARVCSALLAACALLLQPSLAAGAAIRLEPAAISEEVRATLEGLDLPLRDGKGPLTIRCSTRVLSTGDTERVICNPDNERGLLVQSHSVSITRALFGKSFTPARVDGEDVWSLLNFSVVIFEADGATRVRVLPHHGVNVGTLGTAQYTAPQRYTFRGWQCRARGNFTRVRLFSAVVRVSATGEAQEVDFAHPMPAGACFDRIETVLMRSRYIPAQVDGEAVEAFYVELQRLDDPLWDARN